MVWPFKSPSGSGSRKRRESFFVRIAKIGLCVLWVCLILGLAGGGFIGVRYVQHFVFDSGYFKIRQIQISGASAPLEKEARAWLDQRFARFGDNLCRTNKQFLTAGLGKLPQAKSVRVAKIYPQTLKIEFRERQPRMIANLDRLYLMDEDGVLIAKATPSSIRRLHLPILTGIRGSLYRLGDQVKQPHLSDILSAVRFIQQSEPLLQKKVVEWNLNGREEVTAMLDTHTEVLFGDQAPLELLDKLSGALMTKQEAVRRDLEKATYIDLRMERQIVYK